MPKQRNLTVRLLPAGELHLIADEWNALCPAVSTLPIVDWLFFDLLLRHFGTGKERVLVGSDEDRAVVAGIVRPSGTFAWETFQPSQAPIGPWFYRNSEELQHVRGAVLSTLGPICLQLGITQQDPRLQGRPGSSGRVRTVDHVEIARLELIGTYEEYWNGRGKNIKQNMRRQRNKLEREQIRLDFRVISAADEVEAAVDRYSDLEARGWKAQLGTALTRGGAQGKFYSELMREYATRGESRIFELRFNEQLVASDLCLCRNGTLIVLKTTHEESAERMSPSMLLKQEAIKFGYESRDFSNIEYYGRLMDWHKRFTDETRVMYHVNLLRSSAIGYVGSARARLSRLMAAKQAEQPDETER